MCLDQVRSGEVRTPRSRSQCVLVKMVSQLSLYGEMTLLWLCLRVTLTTLHLLVFNFRLAFLELSSKLVRSVCKASASKYELIVLKGNSLPKQVVFK